MSRPEPSVTEELVRHPRIEGYVWGAFTGAILATDGTARAVLLWAIVAFLMLRVALTVRRIVLLKRELRRG